ncbi:TolC family protein [Deinococcus roseus]|uniref:Transporter n=1 Tax=Deinococcus roseus TaxID=392414 RepID=A0ABQ2CWH8_9DEIO|nr:TolC family protein [Deinococcus roseus]GGJ20554.1 hypothetical protein GCM10008938_03550 [Deinococcus roseus]
MHRWMLTLALSLFTLAQATPLPELLQGVEVQPAVQTLQIQLKETALKKNAPGLVPDLALKGDAGSAPDPITAQQEWTGSVGAEITYGWISASQQRRQLDLEVQGLQTQLIETRIRTLKDLLQTEWTYRKNKLSAAQAELDLRTQQLELKSRQARFQLGALTEQQVKNAALLVNRAELQLRQQQVGLKKSLADLQRLKLTAPEVPTELPLPPETTSAETSEVLKTQQQVFELQLKGQKLNLQQWPEVSLGASYSNGHSSLSGSINQNLDTHLEYGYGFNSPASPESWGLKLSARFGLDFTRTGQQDLNNQQLQLTLDTLRDQQQQLQLFRADLRMQLQQNQELLDLSKQVLQLSEAAVEQEKIRLNQGLVSETAVLQVQSQVLKEQQNMLELEKALQDLALQLWEVYTWYPQNGK